ncbi:MAG TPA: lytic murein transglycosylase [Xanthobacteraceae bacterium]|nr:lytic murein transglycosylase [Xanthobacteraceae bacterium]
MRLHSFIRGSFAKALVTATFLFASPSAVLADAAFQQWLATLWPQAQSLGISRQTFEAATRGLEPDLSLPDLDLPGRAPPGQPEFVQSPAEYLSETSIARLAEQGRQLAVEHRATLAAIEREFRVPANVVLAIWGRETAYGSYKLPYSAVRVLATQAYIGKRRDKFREEFLLALKIVDEGHVKLADMKSSWAGAMGLTQFLPSEFYKYAVDFDGDGRRDIWKSVPDALASAAKQLVGKGWQPGTRWAYEVRMPRNLDCTIGVPEVKKPIREWIALGFVPTHGRRLGGEELAEEASLLLSEGTYGPAFLATKNYFVLKDYNFSDLYVLFVGHLSDRISDPRPFETPWAKVAMLKTAEVEKMQRYLTERGIYRDKIDGKAGMLTRSAVGQYQKANGLVLDCWPTAALLRQMRIGN